MLILVKYKNINAKINNKTAVIIIRVFLSKLNNRHTSYESFFGVINIFLSESISSNAIPVPSATQSSGSSAM